MDKEVRAKNNVKIIVCVVAFAILIGAVAGILLAGRGGSGRAEPEIISQAMLEKVLNVSDLSTYQAVYNGIAVVMNEEKEDKVDYYVSYEATVKAGINVENVKITVDDENKVIEVKLPAVEITDVDVDMISLDYIFENNKANTSSVSQQAYKCCIEDAENESNSEKRIYELAEQNAHNAVKAMISPFIAQFDDEYQLRIV